MSETVSTKSILLVEDNPEDADLTRIAFKRNQINNPIIHLENGKEAIDYLFNTGKYANCDTSKLPIAMILDLKLPKLSGIEVLQKIREDEQLRQLPVIILSSSNEVQDTTACRELGITAYLQKPVSFVEFGQAVKEIALILNRLNC